MRRTLSRCQLRPVGPAAQMVLDHGLHDDRCVLGQRVDQQLLPPPEPASPRNLPTPAGGRNDANHYLAVACS